MAHCPLVSFSRVHTFLYVASTQNAEPLPSSTYTIPCSSMVAFTSLRASLVFFGLLAPAALAAPTGTKTFLTPFGDRPAADVHAIPKGMLSKVEAREYETKAF